MLKNWIIDLKLKNTIVWKHKFKPYIIKIRFLNKADYPIGTDGKKFIKTCTWEYQVRNIKSDNLVVDRDFFTKSCTRSKKLAIRAAKNKMRIL